MLITDMLQLMPTYVGLIVSTYDSPAFCPCHPSHSSANPDSPGSCFLESPPLSLLVHGKVLGNIRVLLLMPPSISRWRFSNVISHHNESRKTRYQQALAVISKVGLVDKGTVKCIITLDNFVIRRPRRHLRTSPKACFSVSMVLYFRSQCDMERSKTHPHTSQTASCTAAFVTGRTFVYSARPLRSIIR